MESRAAHSHHEFPGVSPPGTRIATYLPRYRITQSASRFKGTQSADADAHFIPFLSWLG